MADVVQTVLSKARERHSEFMPMLERWVRQNSYSAEIDNVNAMADLMIEGFDMPELTLTRHPGDAVGDHLTWTTPAWDAHPEARCVLIGHHDTVFPPGAFEKWHIDGDILTGPGVLDMKGGLMIVRTTLAALSDAGILADMPIALLSVGDEEIGSAKSRGLTESFSRGARAALVFEAGRKNDMIITARKGANQVAVTVRGRASHSGAAHAEGRSAIWALARFIDKAERYTDYEQGLIVNTGLIKGGSAVNTVPADADCAMSIRFSRTAEGAALIERMRRDAEAIGAESEVAFEFRYNTARPAMQRNDASVALYETYARCARAASLGDTECPEVGGGSDANLVSEIGVAAIDGLGPRGRGFHTHHEYIELSSLPMKIEALARCLLAIAPPVAGDGASA